MLIKLCSSRAAKSLRNLLEDILTSFSSLLTGYLQLHHHHRPVHHHFHEESFGEGGFVAPDGGAGWGGAALYGDGDEFVGAVAAFEVGQEFAEGWQGDAPAGVAVAAVFGVARVGTCQFGGCLVGVVLVMPDPDGHGGWFTIELGEVHLVDHQLVAAIGSVLEGQGEQLASKSAAYVGDGRQVFRDTPKAAIRPASDGALVLVVEVFGCHGEAVEDGIGRAGQAQCGSSFVLVALCVAGEFSPKHHERLDQVTFTAQLNQMWAAAEFGHCQLTVPAPQRQ